MNALLCYATEILNYVVTIFTIALFVYAVASWFPGIRGRWLYYLAAVVEPVLRRCAASSRRWAASIWGS